MELIELLAQLPNFEGCIAYEQGFQRDLTMWSLRESPKKSNSSQKSDAQSNANDFSEITMTLGGLAIKFDKSWKIEDTEFDKAALEIEKVLNERDALLVNLRESTNTVKNLRDEIIEINQTNKTVMDMLLEEKERNEVLQKTIEAYKAELQSCNLTITELQQQEKEQRQYLASKKYLKL